MMGSSASSSGRPRASTSPTMYCRYGAARAKTRSRYSGFRANQSASRSMREFLMSFSARPVRMRSSRSLAGSSGSENAGPLTGTTAASSASAAGEAVGEGATSTGTGAGMVGVAGTPEAGAPEGVWEVAWGEILRAGGELASGVLAQPSSSATATPASPNRHLKPQFTSWHPLMSNRCALAFMTQATGTAYDFSGRYLTGQITELPRFFS